MRKKFAVPVFLAGIGIFSMVMLLMAYPNISYLHSNSAALKTSVFGDKYGVLSGYMQQVENAPCGPGCFTYYIRALATTSRSNANETPAQLPYFHEKVRVTHRVLDPDDLYNKCKDIDEKLCYTPARLCFFSGNQDFPKDYWFSDANTYYISKSTATYAMNFPARAKVFARWPATINGNEAVLADGYYFKGKRTSDQPKICANHGFTPLYEEDREDDEN